MSERMRLLAGLVAGLGAWAQAADVQEGWENAVVGIYAPSEATFIEGDAGSWFLGDTVSQFVECGPTPHRARILTIDGNRVLQLTSNDSSEGCADNVSVTLAEFGTRNRGFAVPLAANSVLTFDEVGELTDPQVHGSGRNCLRPPCFDNVSLLLTDNNGNVLAYVLQRPPEVIENLPNAIFGREYREIFLDPAGGWYRRNLFDDFGLIPTFNPVGARVRSIEFRVDEHGSALLDNLVIGPAAPPGTIPIYRFWSPVLQCHFFTAAELERQKLIDLYSAAWIFEGVGYFALPGPSNPNAMPVYRFWSPVLSSHFYTIDAAERDKLIDQFPEVWSFEGIAFYTFPQGSQPSGIAAVYRFWSDILGCHFYTISETERNKLLSNFPDVWTFEGVAWYAYAP